MKNLNLFATLAAPLAGALLTGAAPSVKADGVTDRYPCSTDFIGEARVGPVRAVSPREAEAMTGTFRMSDGRSMVLKWRGGWISADLDNEPMTLLRASGDGQLHAPDGHMCMRFVFDNWRSGTDVSVVLTPAARQTAGAGDDLRAATQAR